MSAFQEPNGELRKQSRVQTVVAIVVAVLPLLGFIWNQSYEIRANADGLKVISGQISRYEVVKESEEKRLEEYRERLFKLENETQDIRSQNQQSIDERRQLQKLSEDNKNAIGDIREKLVSVDEGLKEVETQFDAIEQASNTRRDETFRWLSIVWNKHADLGPFPTAPYFHSNISNRK